MKPSRLICYLLAQGEAESCKKAYNKLWQHFYPRIHVFVCNAGFRKTADDLLQEIFLKIWLNLKKYKPRYALSTWIYTIAQNHIKDTLRSTARKQQVQDSTPAEYLIDEKNPGPEEKLITFCQNKWLSQSIEKLSAQDKNICYLRFYESMKISEIAGILQIPEGTIKYRIHRIKEYFTQCLKEECFDEN